jgi:signal transduction histidine kinase
MTSEDVHAKLLEMAVLEQLVELAASATHAGALAAGALELILPAVGAAGGEIVAGSSRLAARGPLEGASSSSPIRRGGAVVAELRLFGSGFDGSLARRLASALAPSIALLVRDSPSESQQFRELAALQGISALTQTLDLDTVIARLIESSVTVSHAVSGSVYLRDSARGRYVLAGGVNTDDKLPGELPMSHIDPFFANGLEILDADPHDLASIAPKAAEMGPIFTSISRAIERGVVRILLLPLRTEGRTVGLFTLQFDDRDALGTALPTLLALARHQAVAIDNANAHRLVALRAHLAGLLSDVGKRALVLTDEAQIWQLIVEAAVALTRSDRGLVSHVHGDQITVMHGVGVDSSLVGRTDPANTPYVAKALASPMPIVVEDTATLDPSTAFGKIARANGTSSFVMLGLRRGTEPIGCLFTGSGTPIQYEAEEVEALQILGALASEILIRHRKEAAVELERRRLANTIEHLPIVVTIIHRSGKVLALNRAGRRFRRGFIPEVTGDWISGLPSMVTRTPDGTLVPIDDRLVSRVFRGEPGGSEETVIENAAGQRMHILVSAAAIDHDERKQVSTVVTGFLDVTPLRELANEKDRFLRVASHELRSPITSLKATASLLEMDPTAITDAGRRTLLLGRMQRQIERLVTLVERLIDSSRVSGPAPLQRADVDLVAIAADAVELALSGSSAPATRIQLHTHGPLVGNWDRGRIEQALTNLIGNALRYSGPDGIVEITLGGDEREAHITVCDHGIGVPPEVVDRVFRPFFRAPNAVAVHRDGLGLGMHITAEIVARHAGTIAVEQTPGGGATFVVVLPRSKVGS